MVRQIAFAGNYAAALPSLAAIADQTADLVLAFRASATMIDLVDAAFAAAGEVRAAAFEWTLDEAVSFRGREPPCVLRGTEVPPPLLPLWQALGHALALAGQGGLREREFTPHVTLGYGRAALAQPLAVEPVAWPAQEFALIHHVVGQGACQVLGHWPLTAT